MKAWKAAAALGVAAALCVGTPAVLAAGDDPAAGGGQEPPADPPPADPPPDEPPPDEPPPDEPGVDEAVAAEEARKKEEARIREVVSAFEKSMKKGDVDQQMKAITDISTTKHPLVAKALIPWIQPTVEESVRDLAIEAAKSQESQDVAAAAYSLFEKNAKNLKFARKMIGIMGRSKDAKQVAKLRGIVKKPEYDLDLQREAVIALGLIGHRDAIPDLIRMCREFENPHIPPKEVPRKNALQQSVEEALDRITGTHMPSAKAWETWWRDNEKTFQKGDGQAPK
ncbi:MAG: HEAT repeat domain-containing protein [Planctomycetia bacterium]|nr:HEAT repeat domain-containing protein [Planctomycetia bacterium]